jgi:hypothetical protein
LLDEFSGFFGGIQIGLMGDVGLAVDAGAFDEITIGAVAFLLFGYACYKGNA